MGIFRFDLIGPMRSSRVEIREIFSEWFGCEKLRKATRIIEVCHTRAANSDPHMDLLC